MQRSLSTSVWAMRRIGFLSSVRPLIFHRRLRTLLLLLPVTFFLIYQLLPGPRGGVQGPDARFWPALYAAPLSGPLACQELLTNGDLETSGGWSFGPTPAPGSIVDTPVHGGVFAMRLGIAGGANTNAYSTAYQTVTLPANAEQLRLTYWERPGVSGDSNDYREIVILRTNLTILRSLARQTGAGNDQWTQRSFDITDLRGQSVVVYFNVYNNGSGATLVNYLDDLSLQSCDSAASATPTSTTTTLPTATATSTPTAVVTVGPPTPTATATPLPSGIVVRAGDVPVSAGQNALVAPLDLTGATLEQPVGALSVAVQYDAALLKATGCTTSDSFDLLLCNLAKPGMVQLAGVAATGIHANVRLADLNFDLLQPDNLSTQLTVQVGAVADPAGTALSATRQNGQIGAPCPPGSAGCAAQTIYLPLVQR
ncbi:MAG: hypothetical protein R3C14_18945 [Caldilineaceae bacterium]